MLVTKLSEISHIEDNCIVIPVKSDIKLHPAKDSICAIYIKESDKEYIIPIDHPESSTDILPA